MSPSHETDLEPSAGALQRLARGLLSDHDRAEDAVQDAWLALLRKRPTLRSKVGWLVGATRHAAQRRQREDTRRRRREEAVARDEALESAADTAARLEVVRRLVDAVEELAEPYRTCIVLRFFEDLAPRHVAARLDVPVETVRTRLRRGLVQLRHRLDPGQEEERARLLGALIPLAGLSRRGLAVGGTTTTVGILMSTRVEGALAALGLALLALFLWRPWSAPEPPRSPIEVAAPGAPIDPVQATSLAPERPNSDPEQEPRRVVVAAPEGPWVVRGRVVENGRGVVAARVRLRLYPGPGLKKELLKETTLRTDAAGQFHWGLDEPESACWIEAELMDATTLGAEQSQLVFTGDPPPLFSLSRLPADVELTGRVVDENGEPLAGAAVEAFRERGHADAQGRFRLRGSSLLREHQVTADTPDRPSRSRRITVTRPGRHSVGDLMLPRGRTLAGRVLDPEGQGIEDATLHPRWVSRPAGTTEPDGSFRLEGLDPEGTWSLIARAEGFQEGSLRIAPTTGSGVSIVLEPARSLHGFVRQQDGSPAPGVQLVAAHHPWGLPRSEAFSDAQGAFRFASLPRGVTTIWAWRAGLETLRHELDPELPSERPLELRLRAGRELRGRVVDPEGQPLAWATVGPSEDLHEEPILVDSVYTESDGTFVLRGLPAGRFELKAHHPGYSSEPYEVDPGTASEITLWMNRAGRLRGRVVDGLTGEPVPEFLLRFTRPSLEANDRPLEGWRSIWSEPGQSFVDEAGRFDTGFEDFPADRVTGFEIVAEGYGAAVVPRAVFATDPHEHLIELFDGSRVRGRVLEAETGLPIEGATLVTFSEREPLVTALYRSSSTPTWTTDERGEFEIVGLPPETISLAIEHPRWPTSYDGPFEVPATGLVERRISMGGGRSLTGTLLDAQGAPIADAAVRLSHKPRDGSPAESWERVTDTEGAFAFGPLAPGHYDLGWHVRRGSLGIHRLSRQVELTADADAKVVMRPEGTATLRGRIEGDVDPERVVVTLMADASEGLEGAALARRNRGAFPEDGEFELGPLVAGTYLVTGLAYVDGGVPRFATTRVEVPDGGTAEITLEFED